MTDRFDLEQDIMRCWGIVEDLQNLYLTESLTEDQQQNYLLGLIAIYEVKFEKLWQSFENLTNTGQV